MNFKPLDIFSGYQISRQGVVKSSTGKVLSIFKRNDYYAVALGKNRHEQKMYSLHRLLAIAFLPNPENKRTVNHKDGNKLNNALSNLEWATYQENMQHSFDNRLHVATKGAAHPAAKLNSRKVKTIKSLLSKKKLSQQKIADKFGVSRSCILAIHLEKTWR